MTTKTMTMMKLTAVAFAALVAPSMGKLTEYSELTRNLRAKTGVTKAPKTPKAPKVSKQRAQIPELCFNDLSVGTLPAFDMILLRVQMDATTARFVDSAMAEAFRDATVLAVAHRLPTVLTSCDRVVVMSEGIVVEQGNPRCHF